MRRSLAMLASVWLIARHASRLCNGWAERVGRHGIRGQDHRFFRRARRKQPRRWDLSILAESAFAIVGAVRTHFRRRLHLLLLKKRRATKGIGDSFGNRKASAVWRRAGDDRALLFRLPARI